MSHQDERQIIYFKDLLFAALYQWKKALIFGIAFALLLGTFSILSAKKDNTTEPLTVTPEKEFRIEYLEAEQERLEASIQHLEDYIDHSVLMQLNPYHCASAGFYLYVTTSTESAEEMLLHSYRASLNLADNMEALAQQLDMEASEFQELIIYHSESSPIYYDNCVYIAVRAATLEDAIRYRDAVENVILSQKDSISRTIAPHKTAVYRVASGPTVDAALVEQQNAVRLQLAARKTELSNTQTELNRYHPSLLTPSNPNPVLYAVVGFVMGVCIIVGFAWIKHICSDKVYSARVLNQRTGVSILGSVRSNRKRCKLDLQLRKWEGRAHHTSVASVAANIRNRCDSAKNLLIMGSFLPEDLAKLSEELNKTGILCRICPDPTIEANALNALPESDAVVLVETCNLSRYNQVEWAMQTVADHKKPLLGCVLIDG